jgi:hypothetical protein
LGIIGKTHVFKTTVFWSENEKTIVETENEFGKQKSYFIK